MGPDGPGFVTPFLFRRFAEGRLVSASRKQLFLTQNATAYTKLKQLGRGWSFRTASAFCDNFAS